MSDTQKANARRGSFSKASSLSVSTASPIISRRYLSTSNLVNLTQYEEETPELLENLSTVEVVIN